jgi:hypothetical protein
MRILMICLISCLGFNVSAEEHRIQYTLDDVLYPAWQFAIQNSRYEDPRMYPQIVEMPRATIIKLVGCKTKCEGIDGHYRANAVYIASEILEQNPRYTLGLVTHEFVHFLQEINGILPTESCGPRMEAEKEAYEVQFKFMTYSKKMAEQTVNYMTARCDFNCSIFAKADIP